MYGEKTLKIRANTCGAVRVCVWTDLVTHVTIVFYFLSFSLISLSNVDRILICVVYRNGLSHGDDDDGNENIPETQGGKSNNNTINVTKMCWGQKTMILETEYASKKNVIRRDVLKGLRHANTWLNRFFVVVFSLSFFIFCSLYFVSFAIFTPINCNLCVYCMYVCMCEWVYDSSSFFITSYSDS